MIGCFVVAGSSATGVEKRWASETLRVQRKQTMQNPNKQGVFRLDMREVKEASDSGESPEALPPPPDEAVPSPEGSLDSERASLSDASRGVSFTKNDRDWFVERAAEQLSNAENISNLSKGYGKEQAGSVASSMGGILPGDLFEDMPVDRERRLEEERWQDDVEEEVRRHLGEASQPVA